MSATCFGTSWAIIKEYSVKHKVINKQRSTYNRQIIHLKCCCEKVETKIRR